MATSLPAPYLKRYRPKVFSSLSGPNTAPGGPRMETGRQFGQSVAASARQGTPRPPFKPGNGANVFSQMLSYLQESPQAAPNPAAQSVTPPNLSAYSAASAMDDRGPIERDPLPGDGGVGQPVVRPPSAELSFQDPQVVPPQPEGTRRGVPSDLTTTTRRRGAGGQQTGNELPTPGGLTGTGPTHDTPHIRPDRSAVEPDPFEGMNPTGSRSIDRLIRSGQNPDGTPAAGSGGGPTSGGSTTGGRPNAPAAAGAPNSFEQMLAALNQQFDPLFDRQADKLTRDLTHSAAVSGAINAGGFVPNYLGEPLAALRAEQGAQLGDMMFRAREAELDRQLALKGYDVERYKADMAYKASVNNADAQIAAASMAADASRYRTDSDYGLGLLGSDITRENNMLDFIAQVMGYGPEYARLLLQADPFGLFGQPVPGDVIIQP